MQNKTSSQQKFSALSKKERVTSRYSFVKSSVSYSSRPTTAGFYQKYTLLSACGRFWTVPESPPNRYCQSSAFLSFHLSSSADGVLPSFMLIPDGDAVHFLAAVSLQGKKERKKNASDKESKQRGGVERSAELRGTKLKTFPILSV